MGIVFYMSWQVVELLEAPCWYPRPKPPHDSHQAWSRMPVLRARRLGVVWWLVSTLAEFCLAHTKSQALGTLFPAPLAYRGPCLSSDRQVASLMCQVQVNWSWYLLSTHRALPALSFYKFAKGKVVVQGDNKVTRGIFNTSTVLL